MQNYQHEFIEFAIANQVLCFGEYTLKSGRKSPYFFNSGLFNSGAGLGQLGRFYARTIQDSGLDYDMLFGPAYKGIPLVSATAIALAESYGKDVPYCCDRKEAKDHGEGGMIIGAPLRGRVIIVDDVISAGTSVAHSVQLIRKHDAHPAGVAIALDRQERGQGSLSAVQEVEQRYGIKVLSIITLEHLVNYLEQQGGMTADLERLYQYREKYGIKNLQFSV